MTALAEITANKQKKKPNLHRLASGSMHLAQTLPLHSLIMETRDGTGSANPELGPRCVQTWPAVQAMPCCADFFRKNIQEGAAKENTDCM